MRMKQVSFSELLQKEVRRDYPAIVTAGAGCGGPQRFCRVVPTRTLQAYAACTAITFLSRGKTAPLLPVLSSFSVCGPENGLCPFSQISARTLRAYSARARGSFLVEKKGTKDSPKRKFPLWILLWRGTSPRELRKAKFSPPDFPITRWLLGFASVTPRVVGTYVERTRYRYRGVSKGVMLDPFRWRSRNQEVPCAPFVHFLAIGNGPQGAGAGSHPAKESCRDFPAKACTQTFYEIVSLSAQAREGAKLLLRTLCENDCGLTQPAPAITFLSRGK